MSHPPGSVTSIRWGEVLPWLILVRAAHVALMGRVILLALVGVVVTQVGWNAVNRTLLEATDAPRLAELEAANSLWPTEGAAVIAADDAFEMQVQSYGGPLLRGWRWASQPLLQLYGADGWRQTLGLIVAGLWAIAVWGLFGGAIARIAALYLTYGETMGPLAALWSAGQKWGATVCAPLFAAAAAIVIALPLVLAGLLLKLNLFALLLGIVWFVALLGGVALAILAVGLALGWPLMWATVAVERTDAFDGISRAYAYVFQRPLHLLFFVLTAGLLGLAAQAGVNLAVMATTAATDWAVSAGAGEGRWRELMQSGADESLGALGSLGGKAIRFWTAALASAAAAFPLAYLWPAAVGIYLLLRRLIDSTEMTEVVFDGGDPARGLPTLVNDPSTGVPKVANPAPAAAPTAAASEPQPPMP